MEFRKSQFGNAASKLTFEHSSASEEDLSNRSYPHLYAQEKSCWEEENKPRQVTACGNIERHQFAVGEDKQYFQNRLKYLDRQKDEGRDMYPHKFPVLMSISEYIEKYSWLNNGQHLNDASISLAGRLMHIRSPSSELFIYNLFGGAEVQVVADASKSGMDEVMFLKFHSSLKRGDIVGVIGYPGKSNNGELSISLGSCTVLCPCLHIMPFQDVVGVNDKKADLWVPGSTRNPETYILKDQETRYRQRYLDLILNWEVPIIFKTRYRIISYMREFLDNLDFLEVETPMTQMMVGGAAARPFVTHHNDLNVKLYTRVSPELYLKQAVIGGLDRVYEIGKQFRNERIDLTHSLEFTTCEFYMAFSDYNDMMELTEKILCGMIKKITGGYKIKYHANGLDKDPMEIDFTPPFRRIDLIEELEKMAHLKMPKDLSSDEANEYLADVCLRFELKCPPPQTTTNLLKRLVRHFLADTCANPTFIINHPEIMSPLAKSHRSKPGLSERFELVVCKLKICNGYTELNDPVVQRQRFAQQLKERQSGDEEAMTLDETFCKALEYGLPPTGGCGLFLDRIVMLLTDSIDIKEVILFPTMKAQDESLCH